MLEITDRVVVAVNLMDEARRRGLEVDTRSLARDLGVPVVPIVARTGENIMALLGDVAGVASGEIATQPLRSRGTPEFERAVSRAHAAHRSRRARRAQRRWIAIRLLDGDAAVEEALAHRRTGRAGVAAAGAGPPVQQEDRLAGGPVSGVRQPPLRRTSFAKPRRCRRSLEAGFREEVVTSLYGEVERITRRAVRRQRAPARSSSISASIAS